MSLFAEFVVTRNGFTLDVSLRAETGTTVALLGPNGAGKSTVLAAIAGLVPIERGTIELAGRVLDDGAGASVPTAERSIGLVFQDYLLFPHLTVRDNVAFGPNAQGRGADVDHWLERFGLSELADRRPGELSGGEAQRVALARTLAAEPSALLLDEPMAALDATTRAVIRRYLADSLSGFAGPRLLVTHDPADAVLLADEMVILESGSIVQRGTPEEIRLRPQSAYAADLAGVNFVRGEAASGNVTVDGHVLRVGDTSIAGPVIATIHPRAISLHRSEPEGSPRNAWQTRVERVEHYGDRVRIETGSPLPVTAEVTPSALADLDLGQGAHVWVSIKATEISVEGA